MKQRVLSHESLDVYQVAIRFTRFSSTLAKEIPRGSGSMADQLQRAALSIPLNIAEGYGRWSSKDRNRFYQIALGSAHECGALLDVAVATEVATEGEVHEGKELVTRIVSMLVRMVA